MFSLHDEKANLLNNHSSIYKAIAAIAHLRKTSNVLKFGRMYVRETSPDGNYFHFADCQKCRLAFSRVLFNQEILMVYNTSSTESKVEFVYLDYRINKDKGHLNRLFGHDQQVQVMGAGNGRKRGWVQLYLKPMQLMILQSS
jgi:hypothetical protein